MTTTIQIWTRLHDGIYRSQGGGETRIVAEYNYGSRNLVRAWRHLLQVRADNRRNYGNIGCGRSGLRTVGDGPMAGRTLDTVLAGGEMPGMTHRDLFEQIRAALLTPEQHAELDAFLPRVANTEIET